jgi:sodium/proline symporter
VTIITGMLFTILWISTGLDKEISARVMTFIVAGTAAVLATMLIPSGKEASA